MMENITGQLAKKLTLLTLAIAMLTAGFTQMQMAASDIELLKGVVIFVLGVVLIFVREYIKKDDAPGVVLGKKPEQKTE